MDSRRSISRLSKSSLDHTLSSGIRMEIPDAMSGHSEAFFTFGRFNPPHIGHEALIEHIKQLSANKPYFIILSSSCNKDWTSCKAFQKQRGTNTFTSCKMNENPLTIAEKSMFFSAMFPNTVYVTADNYGNNIFNVLSAFKSKGYTKLTGVFGADRAATFRTMFNKYKSSEMIVDVVAVPRNTVDVTSHSVLCASATKLRNACVAYFAAYQQYKIAPHGEEKSALKNELKKQKEIIEHMTMTQHITTEDHKKLVTKLIKKVGDALWPNTACEEDVACTSIPVNNTRHRESSSNDIQAKRTRVMGGGLNLLKIKIRKRPTQYVLRDDEKPPKSK